MVPTAPSPVNIESVKKRQQKCVRTKIPFTAWYGRRSVCWSPSGISRSTVDYAWSGDGEGYGSIR